MSNPVVWLLRGPILLYRMVPKRTETCRYYPSCSQYSLEALSVHGAIKGTWLTIKRLLRCHPWGGTGIDRVPPKRGAAAVADTAATHSDEPTPPHRAAHTPPGGPSVRLEEQY